MEFEWDEAKRQRNRTAHGIDFADVIQIFDGYTITTEDKRFDYGEIRYLTLGMMRNFVVVLVVHTDRESNKIRIISARKATKHEQKRYFS
ncbi:MAG: BrnT family toxin [Ardenticatenaceae bacterium]|nr:BrnT family toxin [Ardenticatenaceae bacterium]